MSSAAINSTVCRVFTAATGSVVSDSTRFRLAAAIDGAIAGVESLDEFEAVSALLSLETFVRGNNRGGEDTRGVVAGRMDWTSLAMLTWAYIVVHLPPMGQHRFFFQGKERGRNELLALALEKVTGVDINRKVLSSKNQSLQKKIKAKGSADDFCRWLSTKIVTGDDTTPVVGLTPEFLAIFGHQQSPPPPTRKRKGASLDVGEGETRLKKPRSTTNEAPRRLVLTLRTPRPLTKN